MSDPAREGMAIVLALVLLMALTALGHGAFVLGQSALRDALDARAVLVSRLAAEAGVVEGRSGLAQPGPPPSPFASGPQPLDAHTSFAFTLSPLTREYYLVEGGGWTMSLPTRQRVAQLVWRLDSAGRVADWGALIVHGGAIHIQGSARVEGPRVSMLAEDPRWVGCPPLLSALDSLVPLSTLPLARAFDPRSRASISDSIPAGALGRLIWPDLRRLATAVGAAGAVLGGLECADGVAEYEHPPMSCGGSVGLFYASGDVTLAGGVWDGVFTIEGDLVLRGDARLAGMVVVRDRLMLSEDAVFGGTGVVGGDIDLADNAILEGSLCPGLVTVEESPLSGVVRGVGPGSWFSRPAAPR